MAAKNATKPAAKTESAGVAKAETQAKNRSEALLVKPLAKPAAERMPGGVLGVLAQAQVAAPRKRWWWPFGAARTPVMASQMATVKASVLQELENRSAGQGVALSGSPFSRVVLPVAQADRGRPGRWRWWLAGGLVAGLLMVMLLVATRQEQTAAVVLQQTLVALQRGDVPGLQRGVELNTLALRVVGQVQEGATGPDAAVVSQQADALVLETVDAVRSREISPLPSSLLSKIWHQLGGASLHVGEPQVVMQDASMAVAEVPLWRRDIDVRLPLQVVLHPTDARGQRWQVVDMPNLGLVLTRFKLAALASQKTAAVQQAVPLAVRVMGKERVAEDRIKLTLQLRNAGLAPQMQLPRKLVIADAAGRTLQELPLTLAGEVPPQSSRDISWEARVNAGSVVGRAVRDLPLTALTTRVE